jgi:Putative MetA-pathway of phenol degradation
MNAYEANKSIVRSEGIAPTSLGLKYHFIDSAGADRPSVGAIVRVFPPSGTGDFRAAHTTGDFRLAADWDFAPNWSLNPNVGVAFYEDDQKKTYTTGLFAGTLNYNPSKFLNLFVDTGVQYPEAQNGRASVIFDASIAYIVGKDVQVDISIGHGAAGLTPPHFFLAAGVSKRF